MLEKLMEVRMKEGLNEVLMADETYRTLERKESSLMDQVKAAMAGKDFEAVEAITEACNELSSRSIELAYRQGMEDAAGLYRDLLFTKEDGQEQGNAIVDYEIQESGRELQRFIQWRADNIQKWDWISGADSCDLDLERLLELFDSLYEKKLFSVLYLVLYMARSSRLMEVVMEKSLSDSQLILDPQELMLLYRKNLQKVLKQWEKRHQKTDIEPEEED